VFIFKKYTLAPKLLLILFTANFALNVNTHELAKILRNLSELNRKIDQLLPVIDQLARPPDQIILDDVQLREMLKMSKRSTAYLREKGLITYSKVGSKIYYLLSDVLIFLKKYEFPAFSFAKNIPV
jgi:predicted TIM-barrel fold metal-dependent hydrolase